MEPLRMDLNQRQRSRSYSRQPTVLQPVAGGLFRVIRQLIELFRGQNVVVRVLADSSLSGN